MRSNDRIEQAKTQYENGELTYQQYQEYLSNAAPPGGNVPVRGGPPDSVPLTIPAIESAGASTVSVLDSTRIDQIRKQYENGELTYQQYQQYLSGTIPPAGSLPVTGSPARSNHLAAVPEVNAEVPAVNVLDDSEFQDAGERTSYETWKKKGRMSLKKADIFGFIGIFIFGWLLWIVYDMCGKSGWYIFLPIITLYALGWKIHWAFTVIGLIIYLVAWYRVRTVLKRYHSLHEKEIKMQSHPQ